MESRFTTILTILATLKILATSSETENGAKSALRGLEHSVARMRESVAGVCEIGIGLRRIAINATIYGPAR